MLVENLSNPLKLNIYNYIPSLNISWTTTGMFLFTIRYIRYPIHLENQCKKYKALALNERSNLRRRVPPPQASWRSACWTRCTCWSAAGWRCWWSAWCGGQWTTPGNSSSPRTSAWAGTATRHLPSQCSSTFKTTTVTHGLIVWLTGCFSKVTSYLGTHPEYNNYKPPPTTRTKVL